MAWKKNKEGKYEDRCHYCAGTGKVELPYADWSACQCNDHWTLVEHPANRNNWDIGAQLYRCNRCGLVWLVHYDHTDDSIDIPAPEVVGRRIPEDDWTGELDNG